MIHLRTLGTIDLRASDGRTMRSILSQPKRLALLAYLAVDGGGRGHRRDTLVGLFWPEQDQEHGRAALRKALCLLRQSLGEGVLEGRREEEVRLASGAVSCDVTRFRRALEEGGPEEAMRLYGGDFLAGFFLPDAPEFECWLEAERGRLRRRAAEAAWMLATEAERRGAGAEALEWGHRALELSREDEIALREFLSLLDRLGDRVVALRVYEEYRERLAQEGGPLPSAETASLVAAIRARGETPVVAEPGGDAVPFDAAGPATGKTRSAATPEAGEAATPEAPAGDTPRDTPRAPPPGRRRRWIPAGWIGAAVTGAAALLLVALTVLRSPPPAVQPVVAVGKVHDYTAETPPSLLAPALADMLSTNLARVPGLQVVSNARVYEVLGQAEEAEASAPALARSARRAGATEIVEGALYAVPGGALRLDLRRVALEDGAVRSAHRVEGADVFSVADEATAELAREFSIEAGPLRIADVTTGSLVAYRLYEQGLREAYHRHDPGAAYRLFGAALAEDSTFAMAAHYAGEMAEILRLPTGRELGARAVRLAERATERERLLILLRWQAGGMDSLRALATALAARYPTEPDGHLWLGKYHNSAGDVGQAVSHLRRVVELDSAGLRAESPRCRACAAFAEMVEAHLRADSLAAAEGTAREYLRLRRPSPDWGPLCRVLDIAGRAEEARAACQRSLEFAPAPPHREAEFFAIIALRAGDFPRADSLLLPFVRHPEPAVRGRPLWFHVVSLRYQGRLREALLLAEDPIARAIVLFEIGRPREAARLFEEIAANPPWQPHERGFLARHRVWNLAHVATALAAAGETARLPALADSMERMGPESSYGRDPTLHHYVRGLYRLAVGDTAGAEAHFRRTAYSWTMGYTRINLELAHILLARGRHVEAIPFLQAALRGSLEAANLYVTHTELHELLARAFEGAGLRDSALAHYRWVVNAWRDADPPFRARREAALRRLEALGAPARSAAGITPLRDPVPPRPERPPPAPAAAPPAAPPGGAGARAAACEGPPSAGGAATPAR